MSLRRTEPGRHEPPPPLPAPRQDVRVTLPGSEPYGAWVAELAERELALALARDARDPLKPGAVTAMTVEFAGPRGLVRLEGRGQLEARDLVRFRLDGAGEVMQRRDYARIRVVRPMAVARLHADGRAGRWIDTLMSNLSGNGVLAAGPDALALGDAVRFRVSLAEGEPPIEGEGHVARITDDGRRAIAIDRLGRADRERLVRFVFAAERIARQRTRDGEL